MADKGYLPLGQTSMQGIKAYMKQNPAALPKFWDKTQATSSSAS